jgi:hypothetical protein
MLAMLPTQMIRGDGVRDSHLAAVEYYVDALRYLESPSAEALADLLSPTDAATARGKVRALLAKHEARFKLRRKPDEPPPGVVCLKNGCKYVPEAR